VLFTYYADILFSKIVSRLCSPQFDERRFRFSASRAMIFSGKKIPIIAGATVK
jgi:hypothetical protein